MKNIYLLLFFFFGILHIQSQQFEDFFTDKTLRLDYIFAGNVENQSAYLSEVILMNKWHGRVHNLSTSPIQGNGQIRVFDHSSNQLIYVLPFGSLFQEWTTLEDAKTETKSFENSFLIPYPKNEIRIEISFFDSENKQKVIYNQKLNPKDILIRKTARTNNSYETIHQSAVETPIKIALVAEGYTENEMDVFMEYAQKTVEQLFKHQVFNKYKDYFEITAVKTVSKNSGISIPSKNQWLHTALKSNFDTFYSERYLTTLHTKTLHNHLENIPYQHIIILANTDFYGGGGILNSYSLTTTKNKEFSAVVVHEFGHSFAGLADEYFYTNDVFENQATQKTEPWEKNITSLVDFPSKWQHLVEKDSTPIPTPKNWIASIGAYEGLENNGLYIPTLDCRMKINQAKDFCKVCSNAIEEMILFYTKQLTK